MIYFIKDNKLFYDIQTITKILNVSKSKVQRELKKVKNIDFVKHKNLFLYTESTLFELMEKIIIEKINKINDRLE